MIPALQFFTFSEKSCTQFYRGSKILHSLNFDAGNTYPSPGYQLVSFLLLVSSAVAILCCMQEANRLLFLRPAYRIHFAIIPRSSPTKSIY